MTATYSVLINCTPSATAASILEKLRDAVHKQTTGVDYPAPGTGAADGLGVFADQISASNRFYCRINTQQGTAYNDGYALVEVGISSNRLYMRLCDGVASTSRTTDSKGGATVTLNNLNAVRGSEAFNSPHLTSIVSPISSGASAFGSGKGFSLFAPNANNCRIVDNGTNFAFGTGDYSIRLKAAFHLNYTSGTILFDGRNFGGQTSNRPAVMVDSNGSILFYFGGATRIISAAGAFSIGPFHDVELSKSGGVYRLFLDGVKVGNDYADSNSVTVTTFSLGLSAHDDSSGSVVPMSIDEFEVIKGGVAHFTNFTPLAVPTDNSVPYWNNLVCLLHFDDETDKVVTGSSRPLTVYGGTTRYSNQVYLGEAFLIFSSGNHQGLWFAVKSQYGLQSPCAVFGANRWPSDTTDFVSGPGIVPANTTLRVFQLDATGGTYCSPLRVGGVRGCFGNTTDFARGIYLERYSIKENSFSAVDQTVTRRRRTDAFGENLSLNAPTTSRGILRYNLSTDYDDPGFLDGPPRHPYHATKSFSTTEKLVFQFGESTILGYTTGFIPNESVMPSSSAPNWIAMNYTSQSTDGTTGYSRVFIWSLPVLFDVTS